MKLLVPGAGGQLGAALLRLAPRHGLDAKGLTHRELDITNAADVHHAIRAIRPDLVVNAAAWTAVDRAESERDLAFAVNRDGAVNLARTCANLNIPLIHISTDYVFNGQKPTPWTESDQPDPINVYGASKLAGEQAVQSIHARHLILRTSWVFSATGNNFVRTILKLAKEREEAKVVADQIGKPTAADELARIILTIVPDLRERWGIYHAAQPEAVSWHGFAKAILAEAQRLGIAVRMRHIHAIASDDWPTPARRPRNSVLDCRKIETTFGLKIQPWRDSLSRVLAQIASGEDNTSYSHATR